MIARVVALARAEGLRPVVTWREVPARVVDVATGLPAPEATRVRILVPARSSDVDKKPGYLAERAENLAPGRGCRDALAALASGWAAETRHPLAEGVASLLRSPWAPPAEEGWVAFACGGATTYSVPELRALAERAASPPVAPTPARCVACGRVDLVVRVHPGIPAVSPRSPVLFCWGREVLNFGDRTQGENLPVCVECALLANAWLCAHFDARRGSFVLDGEEWRVGSDNSLAYVEDVRPIGSVSAFWETVARWQDRKGVPMRERSAPAAIDRLPAETDCPCYLQGYLYGILEWAAWLTRTDCPPAARVVASPALHLAPLVLAVRDAAERYTPPPPPKKKAKADPSAEVVPPTRKTTVKGWIADALAFASVRVAAFSERALTPPEVARFALGYAHSYGARGPGREPRFGEEIGGRNTPWALRLAAELDARGLGVETEVAVPYSDADGRARRVYIDVAVPSARLAVEVDGRLGDRDHAGDSRKSAVLLRSGWVVHRVPNRRLNRADDVRAAADEIVAVINARAALPAREGEPHP